MNAVIGAICGDIIGSVYEFNSIKTKDFELFGENSIFTDDTVMTLAIANWLVKDKNSLAQIKQQNDIKIKKIKIVR